METNLNGPSPKSDIIYSIQDKDYKYNNLPTQKIHKILWKRLHETITNHINIYRHINIQNPASRMKVVLKVSIEI